MNEVLVWPFRKPFLNACFRLWKCLKKPDLNREKKMILKVRKGRAGNVLLIWSAIYTAAVNELQYEGSMNWHVPVYMYILSES